MGNKDKILEVLDEFPGGLRAGELIKRFKLSRPTILKYLKELEISNKIEKFENGPKTAYFHKNHAASIFTNNPIFKSVYLRNKLKEEDVYEDINVKFLKKLELPEKTSSIIRHAFLEMMNNAIEHSDTHLVSVEFYLDKKRHNIEFIVRDWGIGVFRSIQKKLKKHTEVEAAQDLLKGKLTTDPVNHSGEGIFFTSKAADFFGLKSFKQALIIDNKKKDVQILENKNPLKGTSVVFSVNLHTHKHLTDIFRKYTDKDNYGFSTTEIKVKLFTMFSHHVSRSQARRVLDGLDKFSHIILDFEGVKTIGQAFADQIFRVFKNKYPDIQITPMNMNEEVKFMINRARSNIVY